MKARAPSARSFAAPEIPDRLYFSIREAAELCGVEPHVLRYWEGEFKPFIRPVKKSGNRRFYRRQDLETILTIRHLLYDLGFTIKGAKKVLANREMLAQIEEADVLAQLHRIRAEIAAVVEALKKD
ncbi:MAG: MerR family transcriptional regulator [Zetaproteobacteria bacterium]|nr:MAG: MerR family transcriptional regulator [Zetaproteobacteria bacterium]